MILIATDPSHKLSNYCFWPSSNVLEDSVVDGIWYAASAAKNAVPHRVLPLGECSIGILRRTGETGLAETVRLTITGAHDRPHWHTPVAGWELIMVSLRPERMAPILGLCASDFLNCDTVLLDDHPVAVVFSPVLDEAWAGQPANRLLCDLAATVRRLEQQSGANLSPEAHVAQKLRESRDALRLNHIADELGISTRTLRRRFRDHTGFGLKSYARWLRLSRAAIASDSLGRPNWAEIAADAGYFDQSHMISDYKALIGLTPPQCHAERRRDVPIALSA